MIHHSVLQYYDDSFFPYKSIKDYHFSALKTNTLSLFLFGTYAVDLFIVVSGFSLMLSVTKNRHLLKGGVEEFFKRRIIRILPPYYIAMLFSILLIWLFVGEKTDSHWDVSIPISLKDVVYHTFLIHDFFTSTVDYVNHAFWSIAVEFRIYLFFPLLVLIWRKFGALPVVFFSIFISITGTLLLIYFKRYYPDIRFGTGVSPYIILFTFGMLAADLAFSESRAAIALRKFYYKVPSIIIILVIIGIYFVARTSRHAIDHINNPYMNEIGLAEKVVDVFLGVIFSLVLFVFSLSYKGKNTFNFLVKLLSWKPLIFIGTFSYSLYLIHSPLVALLSQYAIVPLHLDRFESCVVQIVVGTPIIIFISYGFFYLFERPFLTMGKKMTPLLIEEEVVINPAA